MINRIYAEFETPELAELALMRVREKVGNVFSSGLMYDKRSDRAVKLRNGTIYTVIPTAVTTHNYITVTMESPASEDVIAEPARSRKTKLYVICDASAEAQIRAVFSSLGGLDIHSDN